MRDFKLDYIGIGANKAGTSWVNQMLGAHPEICTAEPKEVHFFHDITDFTRESHKGNFAKGLSWYQRFFNHCAEGKVKGEFTPKYLIDPVVPKRIHQMFPNVKLLLCLRSPVDRAVSQYYFLKYFNQREKRPMHQALREEPVYVQNGLYFQALQRYLEYFPLSKIHFIWFEEIKDKPEMVVRDLYAFLGVDPTFVPATLYQKKNAAKRSRFKWMRDFMASGERFLTTAGFSRIVRGLKAAKVNYLLSSLNSTSIQYPKPTDADKAWLLDQFREDILNLQQLSGRDLASWLS